MHKLFVNIFDMVFPPSEDALCVRKMHDDDITLLAHTMHINNVVILSEFKNPYVKALIHETKFHDNTHATHLLAHLCDIHFTSHADQYDIIIPIPLSPTRMRARGYNQVFEVLRHTQLADLVSTKILKRVRDTKPQTQLDKHERLQNIRGAFAVTRPDLVRGKRILLVDDVHTTGATLEAAKAALLPHSPASVTCHAFAH